MTTLTMPQQQAFAPSRRREKTVTGAINGLRGEIKDLRVEIKDLRGEMTSNFRWLVGMYLTGLGVTLAAFYAFASYIKG